MAATVASPKAPAQSAMPTFVVKIVAVSAHCPRTALRWIPLASVDPRAP